MDGIYLVLAVALVCVTVKDISDAWLSYFKRLNFGFFSKKELGE